MSEKKVEVPVWTWRDAIRKAPVKPLTKHICNCIANYVSDVGEGAFPSVRALMADSGLSNRVVALHLRLAEEAGLLHIDRCEPSADGRFRRSRYYPRFPDNTVLKRKADRITTPANDVDDPAEDEDDDAEDQVTESHSAKPSDGKSLGGKMNQVTFQHEPSDFHDINRVTESHSNSPVELSTELSNAHDVRARVRKKFGLMIADLWDEKPELRYVVEIFLAPLHAATRRASGIEHYPAFLAEIRDGIGAKDYPIPVLERACELAKDDRVAMPGRPQCLAYCEQASADIEQGGFAAPRFPSTATYSPRAIFKLIPRSAWQG